MNIEPIRLEDTYNSFNYLIKEDTSRFHLWSKENLESIFKQAAVKSEAIQSSHSGVCIQYLPWDTNFFGFKIGKVVTYGDVTSLQMKELVNTAVKANYKYLFAQIDCQNKAQRSALQDINFKLIETRLTYYINLESFKAVERYDARLATEKDVPYLAKASSTSINEHDRFHADSIFPKAKADELMGEWVRASILTNFADGAMIVNSESPGAFCTFKTHKENWDKWGMKISQPIFSAVGRDYKGWYIKIISELTQYLKDQGAEYSFLITQNTNPAVIKSWERLGYRFGSSDYIFSLVLD